MSPRGSSRAVPCKVSVFTYLIPQTPAPTLSMQDSIRRNNHRIDLPHALHCIVHRSRVRAQTDPCTTKNIGTNFQFSPAKYFPPKYCFRAQLLLSTSRLPFHILLCLWPDDTLIGSALNFALPFVAVLRINPVHFYKNNFSTTTSALRYRSTSAAPKGGKRSYLD